jgi:excisionase family DNA binding protein
VTDQPSQRRFLTIEQAAEELNVKQSLIRGLIKTGELRAIQIGGRGQWRIGRQDIEDYVRATLAHPSGNVGYCPESTLLP